MLHEIHSLYLHIHVYIGRRKVGGREEGKKKEIERGICFSLKNLFSNLSNCWTYRLYNFLPFLEQNFSFFFKAKHLNLDKVWSNLLLSVVSLLYYRNQHSGKGNFNGNNNSLKEGLASHMFIAINFTSP